MAAITSQDWSMAFPGLMRVAPDVTLPISGRDLEEMLGATNEGWGTFFPCY